MSAEGEPSRGLPVRPFASTISVCLSEVSVSFRATQAHACPGLAASFTDRISPGLGYLLEGLPCACLPAATIQLDIQPEGDSLKAVDPLAPLMERTLPHDPSVLS